MAAGSASIGRSASLSGSRLEPYCEYLVAQDEGHGFATPLSNIAMFAEIEQFFAAHLSTRFQATMRPAVAERVKLLTVDPTSVSTSKGAALERRADSPPN